MVKKKRVSTTRRACKNRPIAHQERRRRVTLGVCVRFRLFSSAPHHRATHRTPRHTCFAGSFFCPALHTKNRAPLSSLKEGTAPSPLLPSFRGRTTPSVFQHHRPSERSLSACLSNCRGKGHEPRQAAGPQRAVAWGAAALITLPADRARAGPCPFVAHGLSTAREDGSPPLSKGHGQARRAQRRWRWRRPEAL